MTFIEIEAYILDNKYSFLKHCLNMDANMINDVVVTLHSVTVYIIKEGPAWSQTSIKVSMGAIETWINNKNFLEFVSDA